MIVQHPAPAAIAGIAGVLRAADSLAGVLIDDGRPSRDRAHREVIRVGRSASTALAGQVVRGLTDRLDQFDVGLGIEVVGDGADVGPRRDRVFELLALVDAVLEEHRQLGGSVFAAQVARWAYDVEVTQTRVQVRIDAAVAVRAFRPRRPK